MPNRDDQAPRPDDAAEESPAADADCERSGLPDPTTVISEETFTSPKGRRYRVLKTRQTDPYDDPPAGEDRRP
jgi:hypothetical protein